ncbi:MAG: VWA domain-containing protein [Treponema sp.]|nr:VWA domain-containing protein [Treponema sp.]
MRTKGRDTFRRFHSFIRFGGIADQKAREEIADAVYAYLLDKPGSALRIARLSAQDTDNFARAIETILANQSMRELCAQDALHRQTRSASTPADPLIAEELTQEILDFITTVKRRMQQTESPFAVEQQLLGEFESLKTEDFEAVWEGVALFIQETYEPQELDTAFYTQEFLKSLVSLKASKASKASKPRGNTSRRARGFAGVKAHFTERWGALLARKQAAWEEERIEEHRKRFCQDLYQRIEAYKHLAELFNSSPGEPRRIWDLSRSVGRQAHVGVLHTYARLLEQDPLIQELAATLGRRETDEEDAETLMEEQVLEPEMVVEQASKAELIGVHESDDLSSIVPAEAALLADETAQWVFYKKFAEKKLQTFAYRHKTLLPLARYDASRSSVRKRRETPKGPVILCIDTSGSMRGLPEQVAKTLCFALLKVALSEGRSCYLIAFALDITRLDMAETLELTDLGKSLERLSAFLSTSFYGGTNAGPAIHEALRMLETRAYRKADVVMVSDFIMPPLDAPILDRIQAAQKQRTKFHSLLIGDRGSQGINKDLLAVFDSRLVYAADIPAF